MVRRKSKTTGTGRRKSRPKPLGKVERVTFEKPLEMLAAGWLIDHPEEFHLVDEANRIMSIPRATRLVDIFLPRKIFLDKTANGKHVVEKVRIATVYFRDQFLRATPRRWVINVIGPNNIDMMTQLANGLAAEFNVRVLVSLINEEEPEEPIRRSILQELKRGEKSQMEKEREAEDTFPHELFQTPQLPPPQPQPVEQHPWGPSPAPKRKGFSPLNFMCRLIGKKPPGRP